MREEHVNKWSTKNGTTKEKAPSNRGVLLWDDRDSNMAPCVQRAKSWVIQTDLVRERLRLDPT
jgi:hypothetical protein